VEQAALDADELRSQLERVRALNARVAARLAELRYAAMLRRGPRL
jgi:hypothetical protein